MGIFRLSRVCCRCFRRLTRISRRSNGTSIRRGPIRSCTKRFAAPDQGRGRSTRVSFGETIVKREATSSRQRPAPFVAGAWIDVGGLSPRLAAIFQMPRINKGSPLLAGEISQVWRRLIPAGGHQFAVRAQEIVFVFDLDPRIVLRADGRAPERTGLRAAV